MHVTCVCSYTVQYSTLHSRTKINNINNVILYYAWYLLYTISLVPRLLRLTVLYTIQYNLPYIIIQNLHKCTCMVPATLYNTITPYTCTYM